MGPTSITSTNGTTYGPGTTPTLEQLIHFHNGRRQTAWKVNLLAYNRSFKSDLTPYVTRFSVQHDTTRAVKRTLTIDMVETVASQTVTVTGATITSAGIDYLNDLVQPVCRIGAPDGGWLEFPLGVFRFTQPGVIAPGYAVVRHAEMPDLTFTVQQNQATDSTAGGVGVPLTLPEGAYITDVITDLLQNSPLHVQANPATLGDLPGCNLLSNLPANVAGTPPGNTPGDWPTSALIDAVMPPAYVVPEGTSYLDLINRLCYYIGCYNLQADEQGVFRIQKWPVNQDYTTQPVSWTYDTTQDSIVAFGLTEEIRLDTLYNVVEVVVEDGSRATFRAMAVNDDPGSPFSVANLGRRVVNTLHDPGVPTNGAGGANFAQMYARQQLLMASWLTDEVQLPIAVNPLHAMGLDEDVIALNIYQQYVAVGSPQNNPIIVGIDIPPSGSMPGLISTEKFLVDGWQISAVLPRPGTNSIAGSPGVTTDLEPRDQKPGSTMSLTCHRITTTVRATSITVT